MKLIFCLDDSYGLAFNKRRQSRDRMVVEKIEEHNKGNEIAVNPYSEGLFEGKDNIVVTENLMEHETVFAERVITEEMMTKACELEVYFWNRAYPGDSFAHIDENLFIKTGEEEFKGTSHDKITCRTYKRRA